MNHKIQLNNVRLAFPHIYHAQQVNGEGEARFSAVFLLDPKDPQVKTLYAAFEQVAKDKWGAKADTILKTLRSTDKTALHNGDTKESYDGFADMLYISASSKVRPLIIDANKVPLAEEDGKPYAGCYVNASIDLWAMDNKFGKRINAGLRGVQFYRDGDAFAGGAPASADEFDDVSEGADAEAFV